MKYHIIFRQKLKFLLFASSFLIFRVTGGASGIGLEITKLLAAEGANVAIFDLDPTGKNVESTIRDSGGEVLFIQGSVTKEKEIQNAVEQTVKEFGALDILVNAAGIFFIRDILDSKVEDWDSLFDVNVKGPYLFSKHAVRQMRNRGGSIVTIGSDLGVVGLAGCTAYCASKGAVINFTRAPALECAKDRIRVNCVCPCSVETPMFMGALKSASEKVGSDKAREDFLSVIPLGRFGIPIEIARAVLFVASDEASCMTGSIIMCDGGKTAH